jgi:hypothetical protein
MVKTYAKYLVSVISAAVNDNDKLVAKYRYLFMDKNGKDFSSIITRSYTKSGSYNYSAMVKDMRAKSLDISILDDFNNTTLDKINGAKLPTAANLTIDRGLRSLNIFRWLGEIWANKKHEKYLDTKRTKDWMDAQVALIKMRLDDTDVGSKAYKKTLKIVERYETMINKADRDINDYEKD